MISSREDITTVDKPKNRLVKRIYSETHKGKKKKKKIHGYKSTNIGGVNTP